MNHTNPTIPQRLMLFLLEVWRMIKVYGMIILVMAMDIDGCALAKSVVFDPLDFLGRRECFANQIVLTPRCSNKCVPFRETTLMELLSNLHAILCGGSSFNPNLFLGFCRRIFFRDVFAGCFAKKTREVF